MAGPACLVVPVLQAAYDLGDKCSRIFLLATDTNQCYSQLDPPRS
jgi:hypothetical protein